MGERKTEQNKKEEKEEKRYLGGLITVSMGKRKREEKEEKGETEEKGTADLLSSGKVATITLVVEIIVVYLTVRGVLLWEDLLYNILIGVGVVFLLIALLDSIVPQYRRPILVKVIAGLVLLTVSIVGGYKPEWWPLIPVIVCVLIVIYRFRKMKGIE